MPMRTISATKARQNLYHLIDEVAAGGEPLQIAGPRSKVVVISDEEWRGIEETLYLLSIPGMRESILEGMAADSSEFSEDAGW